MKTPPMLRALVGALLVAAPLHAVDLKVDINQRSATNNVASNTEGGFTALAYPSTLTTANPSTSLTVTFGAQTVTIAPAGTAAAPVVSDRKRTAPVNNTVAPATFTQQALLQDFIFGVYSTGTTVLDPEAGLNITITGLTVGKEYSVTLWSYDASSSGTRVSNWSANGNIVVAGYTFDGRVAPTTNEQYQINFTAIADATGRILIRGRRDPTSVDAAGAASHGVFLNALWVRDLFVDEDNDLIPDGWETSHGLDPAVNDAALDPDNDGLTNLQEYQASTDPQDNDSDNDLLLDGYETNSRTWVSASNTGTSPLIADTDGDGLGDGVENPGLPWLSPTQPGTNPNLTDTDGDAFGDGTEVNWPSNPKDPLLFPNPGAGGTLAVDLENTTAVPQPGFETFFGTTDAAVTTTLTSTYGSYTVTINAVGVTTLRSRDRGAAAGGGDFNPLFRDFIYSDNSDLDDEGMDVVITGLTPLAGYPITLWSWDATSAGTARHSTWLASDGDNPPVVKVPVYSNDNAALLPTGVADRRMQFTARANSSGKLVIQGRKEPGYTLSTINVFLNAFVIGPAVTDVDGDQMIDSWELAHDLDPTVDDAAFDADTDGLTNLEEFQAGTDPQDVDSDNDTLADGAEKKNGVWVGPANTGTDPLDADSDNDGLSDGVENPELPWTGRTQPGTDPNKYDTDGDSFGDGTEVNWPTNPEDPLLFPNPAAGSTLAVDIENTTPVPQPGFEAFPGPGTGAATSLTSTFGTHEVTITAAGSTTLLSRDRAAAAGGGDFNPLFRDFIFSMDSGDEGDGMDVTITGLTPFTIYPVTLWAWDPTSSGTPRHSSWLSKDGGGPSVVKVPLYSMEGAALPTSLTDRRMQFTAATDATGNLVIQGRKEDLYTGHAINVFLNGFIIGAPAGIFTPPVPINITGLGPVTPQGMTLTWASEAGTTYKVEASPNLAGWTTLSSTITGLAGSTSYTDTTAPPGATERYYRVSRAPQ